MSIKLFLITICFSLTFVNSFDINNDAKLIGPDELTDFLVHRLGGFDKWDPRNWREQSTNEASRIFFKHGIRHLSPVPCIDTECKKSYTDDIEGSASAVSKVSDGNQTITVNSKIDGKTKLIYNSERDQKEEKHCLVIYSNTSLANQGPDFDYAVNSSVFYGGGVTIKPLMAEESNTVNLEEGDEDGLVRLHLIWASAKSSYEKLTVSQHYSEKLTKSNDVTATVVTFDAENCESSTENSNVKCDTLARVYHHIKSSTERRVTYKENVKNYKADSYGTIVTVIKKI